MGVSKTDIEFAKSFVRRAELDLSSAKHLLKHKNFADSAYHSQQSAEKIVKAILVLENMFVRDHLVSDIFVEIREKYPGRISQKVLDTLKDLEKHWVKPRYPFISKGVIWDPSKEYTKEIAEEALKQAEFVFETLSKVLEEDYNLKMNE